MDLLDFKRRQRDKDVMFTRRAILPLLIAAPLAGCVARGIATSAQTTVIMLRHADRIGDALNDRGRARAQNLPAALSDYQIDAIYSPDIARNLETAEPLSAATGLPVTIIPKEYAGSRMTRDHPNGTVVWVGNKGNLRTIWAELTAPGEAPQEYGEIGVIKLNGPDPRTVTRLTVTP